MEYIFEFLTMSFPKSGLQIRTPITFSMLLILFLLIKKKNRSTKTLKRIKGFTTLYFIFVMFIAFSFIFNPYGFTTDDITKAMVLVGSPIALVIGTNMNKELFKKIMAYSLVIVGGYSLIQRIFGIISTAIPGLTYTFGQNLMSKPIGYGVDIGKEAIKMPSTYQNGNLSGIFLAIGVPIMINWLLKEKKNKLLKIAAILFGVIGIYLSGSRSVLIPFLLISLLIPLLSMGKLNKKTALLFISISLFVSSTIILYLYFSHAQILEQAYNQYVGRTLLDPTGNGRTEQYMYALNQMNSLSGIQLLRFIFIGFTWNEELWLEGFIYLFFNYGLFSFLSLIILLLITTGAVFKENKIESLGFISVIFDFMVDGSFVYPPSLMIIFLTAGALINKKLNKNNFSTIK
ncbi:hypothetical protein [Sporolactobacillus spathodeae]|uniref:O-antigen ligase domain-containing protein n=1 Tax=Sporolactobacillus spathodeae TaxID=1465502 RepID=A0ABS2Q813_9BACL|nr:hypothetical protein [Sporolactobacillus spathodeae]MBM7657746.1 hypothetical protein [Sporolactobacillus spathodeae]